MDKLLNPDSGLIIWTVVTFLSLVFALKKLAWGPLIEAIEEREAKMKAERAAAESARAASERIKAELEAELAGLEARGREMLARARREGEALRASAEAQAEASARRMKEKTLAELAEEKERLVGELRASVAELSLLAAEKLLRRSVGEADQKAALEALFSDLDRQQRRN